MKVFNCIFGILSIIGAIYCMFYPGLTFLNAGWIVTILLGVWGICSVIDYFAKRKKAKAEQSEACLLYTSDAADEQRQMCIRDRHCSGSNFNSRYVYAGHKTYV